MAVILKGILSSGSCPWLSQMFPLLSALVFALPPGNPDVEEFTNYGRDHGDSSDESSSDSGNDGDPSGDFIPRGVLDTRFPPVTQLSAVNTIVIAKHKFTGNWLGELGESSGQSIEIISRLSEGRHGIVYTGILTRHSRVVAKVAVKASDDKLRLLAEFSRYKELQDLMGSYLPRCHGICITSRSAFLITSFVQDQGQKSKLSKAESGAVYAALTKLHGGGWTHNDIVDPVTKVMHNLLWTAGRPVFIDLVTVARHDCDGNCAELTSAQQALRLSPYEIAIWAR
ncbi:hypothetical protein R3P38DRAFT_1197792 [Favolaschia claudopus]|uniref:Protein kinase domain-containing protein n=1 Tax=Favolaschia claudopus TaxID=2862362 RepID=A0AAW0B4A5_9AGAR